MALLEQVKHPQSGTWYVDYGHRTMGAFTHKWQAFEYGWASVTARGFDTRKAAEAYARQRNNEATFAAQQYAAAGNDATVTADDIRADRNAANAEGHADAEHVHVCATCTNLVPLSRERCDDCNARISAETAATIRHELCGEYEHDLTGQHATIREAWTDESRLLFCRWDGPCVSHPVAAVADMLHKSWKRVTPASRAVPWNARLAARAASIVTAAGGLALALSCLAGTPASASTLPLVPTDGECVITHQWDDGSAIALCGHDVWAYDSDGGYVVDNGIVFFYRDPGTWFRVR